MVFLKDFNKTLNDMMKKKKFAFYRTLEVKADSGNVFSWKAKTNVSGGKNDAEVEFTQKEKGIGEMKCKFTQNKKNQDDVMELEAKSKDVPVLSELKCKVGQAAVELTGKYTEDPNYALQVKASSGAGMSVVVDAVVNVSSDVVVGVQTTVGGDGSLKDYAAGVQYKSGCDQQFSIQATKKLNNVTIAGYLPKSDYFGKIGAQVDVTKVMAEPEAAVSFGGLYALNDKANMRWRAEAQKRVLNLQYEYQFASNVQGMFTTSVDMNRTWGPMGAKFVYTV